MSDDWTMDPETGVLWPPPLQQEFLDWFLEVEAVGAQRSLKRWADQYEHSWREVRTWWNDDRFVAAFNQQCQHLNNRPDRVQNIVDALYKRAISGDCRSAELYLRYVQRLNPVQAKVEVRVKSVKDLSRAELEAELRRVRKALPAAEVEAEVVG